MMNTKAFYKLSAKRRTIEKQIKDYEDLIKQLRTEAKKLKKGSTERQNLVKRANDLSNCIVYNKLKVELQTMNFCINTMFYN